MDIVGDRKFVEVPGEKTHELPPLLVRTSPNVRRLDRVVGMANNLIDAEDMMAPPAFDGPAAGFEMDRRKMDLAINLADQYLRFVTQWQWGDSILEGSGNAKLPSICGWNCATCCGPMSGLTPAAPVS